jgi:hypothetical protein
MLLVMAEFPGQDPSTRHPRSGQFHQLLADLDPRVVLYLAEAEAETETHLQHTENRYLLLRERGFHQLNEWQSPVSFWVDSLPLYNTARLAWLLANGYTPTQGKVLFAGVDVVFTAIDLATLGSGKAATTVAKGGLQVGKVAGKRAAREVLADLAETTTPKVVATIRSEMREGVEHALAGRLSASPRVVSAVAKQGLLRDPAVAAAQATRTAHRLNLRLTVVPVARFALREWKRNVVIGGSLKLVVEQVAKTDNTFWARKVREALLYLNRVLDTPLETGRSK